MSEVTIQYRFVVKRDTAANFTAANTLLKSGEWALETDTRKLKMGDGTTAWNSLAYVQTDVAAVIHAATGKTTPVDADELALIDSAASNVLKKLTWANLKAGIWTAWGALINSGTGKTTPVDADAIALMDSAASNATKKLTWANIKATLKTYFDTLYAAAGSTGSVTLIGTATVSGSATTAFTLSPVNLSGFKSFRLEFAVDNATASGAVLSLYYNGDTTNANYTNESITANNTTTSTARSTAAARIGNMDANETSTGYITIQSNRDGSPRALSMVNRGPITAVILMIHAHGWVTAANVTSITLSSDVANSLAVGSTFTVYGMN